VAASTARLRIWKTDFSSGRVVSLTLRPAQKGAAPTELGEYATESQFGDYSPVPAGDGTVEAHVSGDAGAPVATFATHLADDGWSTLILRETADSTLTFELLDDRPTGDKSSAELVVRNFVPALRTLQVDGGPNLHVRLTTPGSFLHLRGLPRDQLEVKTKAEDGTGTEFNWTNQIDLRRILRATILVVTDRAGRIRSRVVVDAPGFTP
jgi:hypothetical protein